MSLKYKNKNKNSVMFPRAGVSAFRDRKWVGMKWCSYEMFTGGWRTVDKFWFLMYGLRSGRVHPNRVCPSRNSRFDDSSSFIYLKKSLYSFIYSKNWLYSLIYSKIRSILLFIRKNTLRSENTNTQGRKKYDFFPQNPGNCRKQITTSVSIAYVNLINMHRT